MCNSTTSNPACSARHAARVNSSRTRSMSARVISRGAGQPGPKGIAEGPTVSQPPSRSGASPSHGSEQEPFRPAWASWMPIRAGVFPWTKSTMRFQAAAWASLHIPAHPLVMRPPGETSVISVKTSPAPPTARLPRWTRCQSPGMPSAAEYWHMGLTTTRFGSSRPRRRSGAKIGGGAFPPGGRGVPFSRAYHSAACSTRAGSRSRRLSKVMRRDRVIRLKENCTGCCLTYRPESSNQAWLVRAARWSRATSGLRASS